MNFFFTQFACEFCSELRPEISFSKLLVPNYYFTSVACRFCSGLNLFVENPQLLLHLVCSCPNLFLENLDWFQLAKT
jgi:hypothetical protein